MLATFSRPPAATVMVVDDEPFIRTVVARALDEINYFTIEAESAEVALDLLHADPGIDLLIIDIHLDGTIDGHQLALKAYSIIPAVKVIFMTGDFVAAARLGKQPGLADGVLVKPFRLEDLWQMVEGCLKTA